VSNSDTTEPTEQPAAGHRRSLVLWLLITLVAGALLALLLGSATPRIRLLGIYPLAIGAFVAFGALGLLAKFDLKLDKILCGWIVLLAIAVVAGSTAWSWQIWKTQLTRDHAIAQERMSMILKDIDPDQQALIRRENMLKFRETITFPAYLSDRLKALVDQIGRKNVWGSPVPEIIFGVELFLALVGAWVVVLQGNRELPED
jgi:hypothetical protein